MVEKENTHTSIKMSHLFSPIFLQPMNGGGRQLRIDEMFQAAGQNFGHAAAVAGRDAAPPPVVVSPGHLQILTDMGFSRDRAEQVRRNIRYLLQIS